MRNFDLSPLFRSTVGFDQLDKLLDSALRDSARENSYPPYNIAKLGQDKYRITMAVAGFAEADLDVQTEENQLVIRGKQTEDAEREYLHRGIAARQFQRVFMLADGMRVLGAELKNGLLSIDLDRPQPEKLVRKIGIKVSE